VKRKKRARQSTGHGTGVMQARILGPARRMDGAGEPLGHELSRHTQHAIASRKRAARRRRREGK